MAVGAALSAGCESKKGFDLDRTSSFRVEILAGGTGSEQSPMPFESTGAEFTLRITAIDGRGETKESFAGEVEISSEPGDVDGDDVTFVDGVATATVTLNKAFGPTRIWVEDPETYATGVTDAIWYRGPAIDDVQTSTTTVSSPFEGERVEIDDTTNLVVTSVARDGFYVTDVDVAGGAFASVFAYTFGAPQGLGIGDRLTSLSGRVSEFLGFTELNNPSWDAEGTLALPEPAMLTCAEIADSEPNLSMEAREASLVAIEDATIAICSSYPNCPDFDEYRQWTVTLAGGCEINVVSRYTLGNFDPEENEGEAVPRMSGTLRHIQFADPQWILEPRDAADVCCPTCSPALNQGC